MRGTIAGWKEEGRTVLAIDAATLRDSPVLRRGLRRRGGKGTIRTNHSKKAMHLVGALGDGTLDLQFHEDLKAGSYVDLVEYARRRHKKIGIIIPERRRPHRQGHTGLHLRYEWNRRDGAHPAPHPTAQPYGTPEIEWREIRAAIADIFFGSLDKMRDAIMVWFRNREIPIVKLFEWLLFP
ncbi:MAG: hypothetical protein J4G04_08625 [Nitrosopumilaceae archaeon]|nr:hypothetical protein [Nitrosopumilaceae archaeon]